MKDLTEPERIGEVSLCNCYWLQMHMLVVSISVLMRLQTALSES